MGAIITQAGLDLLAYLQANSETLNADLFVYADLQHGTPELAPDPMGPIAPHIVPVHTSAVTQVGNVGDDTVVYSNILASSVGDFYFDWVGLKDSGRDVLVAASYVPRQQKKASSAGSSGNTLTKNFAIQYNNLASLANVSIAPETWMIDFGAELTAVQAAIDTHSGRTDNPHSVTREQLFAAAQEDLSQLTTLHNTHIQREDNPHVVTREQIAALGLDDFQALVQDNGYIVFPTQSGQPPLIMQWGRLDTPTYNTEYEVVYPMAFPNAVFSVVCTQERSLSNVYDLITREVKKTSFRMETGFINPSGTFVAFRWVAIGY